MKYVRVRVCVCVYTHMYISIFNCCFFIINVHNEVSIIPRDEKVAPAAAGRKYPKANLRPASSSHSTWLHQRDDSQAIEGPLCYQPYVIQLQINTYTYLRIQRRVEGRVHAAQPMIKSTTSSIDLKHV